MPKGDKNEFAKKIIEFLDNEHSRNELSEVGIQFIKRYDWQKIADEEMKLITNSTKNHEVTNK